MDNSKYSFRIDYQDGLQVEVFNNYNKDSKFRCFVYVFNQKIKSRLQYNYNGAGAKWVEEELVNQSINKLPWHEMDIKSHHWSRLGYKGFIPFYLEIMDLETEEIVYKESFDPRHKLINFTLYSQNTDTIHTWMCAIEKFKKEHNCQISITNDYLKNNQKYNFVDSYWGEKDNFVRYYAGFKIGRFGTENIPELNLNPDGIKDKNDLEIIEDILYHYTKHI